MPSKESTIKIPPRWSDDALSSFMTDAFKNSLASFVRRHGEFEMLLRIHSNFAKICDNLANPPDFLGAIFIIRSHGAWLGAVRLALSGQVPETYPLLRSSLEYALYALQINKTKGLGEVWIRRHDDGNSIKAMKKAFQHVTVMDTLKTSDSKLHATLETLYERTID